MTSHDIRRHINLIESARRELVMGTDWVGVGREFARESSIDEMKDWLRRRDATPEQCDVALKSYQKERETLIRTS